MYYNYGRVLIMLQDEKCTIDRKTYFDTTDELLMHYHDNCLPGKSVKLTKAYLLQSAGYVNQRYTCDFIFIHEFQGSRAPEVLRGYPDFILYVLKH